MACFQPLDAWRTDEGKIRFQDSGSGRHLQLPCGRCIGCRLVKQRSWAIRIQNEAAMHQHNSFVTLTYEGNVDPSLNYRDFQEFMWRLRKKLGPTRFFVAGEYGGKTYRPHWHAVLFGRSFENHGMVAGQVWRNRELEQLWPHGYSSVGHVTEQSAAYVARYCTKKINGPAAEAHYRRVDPETGECYQVQPEMARMSLKPGLGATWLQKYWREVYVPRDGIVKQGGNLVPPPRYYDKWLASRQLKQAAEIENKRYQNQKNYAADQTRERLRVRETCAIARLKHTRNEKL